MKHFLMACLLFSMATAFGQSANLTTVLNNYAAFGRGDIPAIVATTTEQCTWTHAGNASVPFAGTFVGHDGIVRFFTAVGKSTAITTFEPSNFREVGNQVINDVLIKGTALSTGLAFESKAVFTWTFDATGKISDYVVTGDMSSLEKALAGK